MASRGADTVAGRARLAALPETGRRFLAGLSWIAVFFAGARAASLGAQFLAGRLLGPDEFGRAHLVMGVAASIQILPMLGFPFALSRAGAGRPDSADRRDATNALIGASLVWGLFCVLGLAASGPVLSPVVGLDHHAWGLCIALAAATALHLTLGGALQGLGRFKERGVSEAVYGLASFTAVALWLSWGTKAASAIVGSYVIGLVAAGTVSLWRLRGTLRSALKAAQLKEALPFATLGALTVVGSALIQTPGRVVLFHLDSPRAAGIFSAYFMATVQVGLALVNMLQAVLIPLASHREGQREAWTMLRRWGPPAAVALPGLFAIGAAAVIAIMGRSYPLEPLWVLLFALAASAILVHSVLAAVFAARDLSGLLTSIGASLGAGLLNLLLTLSLAPHFGVAGAAFGLALSHAASAGVLLIIIPKNSGHTHAV